MVVFGARQGPWAPSGLQPIVSSVATEASVTNSRVSWGGCVDLIIVLVAFPSETNATLLPSGEYAMSTARTRPGNAGPALTVPSGATALTAAWTIEPHGSKFPYPPVVGRIGSTTPRW